MIDAVAAPAPIQRRPLGLLAAGHFCTDFGQGAIPAMLPFLMQERGLSYATAFGLVLPRPSPHRSSSPSSAGSATAGRCPC